MKKIVHVITGLQNGGAEMMLYKLMQHIDLNKYSVEVVSMTDRGVFGEKIENLGVKVHTLDMKRGIPTISGTLKLLKIIKDADIVQTWMYHADLLGFIVGKILSRKTVIWGIHHSNLDKDKNKKLVLIVAKINSYASKYVNKIVSCSSYATKVHIEFGYDKNKFINIPNGFDIEKYYRVDSAKENIIDELGEDIKNKKLICHVARWDPLKDYNTLLKSISIVKDKTKDIIFLLCGTQIDRENKELLALIKENNIQNYVYLLGRRNDIPTIMSASDLLVLSSSGEAFPNVIGEAMACETPCVVTDVGDCRYIVGDYGKVVEKENPKELANGILDLINLPADNLTSIGLRARNRVLENFEINKVVKLYENLYN